LQKMASSHNLPAVKRPSFPAFLPVVASCSFRLRQLSQTGSQGQVKGLNGKALACALIRLKGEGDSDMNKSRSEIWR
jgi:hypothetical protein